MIVYGFGRWASYEALGQTTALTQEIACSRLSNLEGMSGNSKAPFGRAYKVGVFTIQSARFLFAQRCEPV